MFKSFLNTLDFAGTAINIGGDGVCYFDTGNLEVLAEKLGVDIY